MSKPRMLVAYKRKCMGNTLYVKLTDNSGRAHDVRVASIMLETWLGGKRDGYVAYHKNGNITDNSVWNFGFCTRKQLAKHTGGKARRKPVVKIDESGEEIEFYRSARAAAKANYMNLNSVLDRCNKKLKNPYFNGITFRWDE